MDNITKGFVIAACSVVIAVSAVWLDGRHKYSKALQTCMALTYTSSEPLILQGSLEVKQNSVPELVLASPARPVNP